jgi:DNA mismatch endonuclease (patch repair protein)
LFKWPGTRQDFWQAKIGRNAENDARNLRQLGALGWRVATVWECALKGRGRLPDQKAIQLLDDWLRSGNDSINIRGTNLG